ncbi:MAG: STAS domain-containing protein [Clostridiales bacterium]|jgi:anti-sigma B factor antagonist|nr:STAS domain-containing protein [Clostridiales bacterium]
MEFSIESNYDVSKNGWEVIMAGEIDIFNSEQLKSSLLKLINEKGKNLYLDCAKLTFIDSTALGALVGVLKNVKQGGGDIYINSLKPNLTKLFKITNLDKVFIIEVN